MRWLEGPKCAGDLDFILAEPVGQMMRYQYTHCPTLFDRWAEHVSSWLSVARRHPWVFAVDYDALLANSLKRFFECVISCHSRSLMNPLCLLKLNLSLI